MSILRVLGPLTPQFTLTGGGALAGFHTQHRTTRDLDLFWRGHRELGDLVALVEERLRGVGFEVTTLRSAQSFHRFEVRSGQERCVLDLVADPTQPIDPPECRRLEDVDLSVESRHQLLVNKFLTLLGRAEIRDLRDLRELLATGGDFARAVRDAGETDRGFSALTLAWILEGYKVPALARAEGLDSGTAEELERFRVELMARLTAGIEEEGGPAQDPPSH
ncbi:MAG: nucleotidyl transferase AbiEii/AbiGii toxin family protein [Planctomycetes bacterium]|nr:nucleotidyl transferase AbiEii/AbiGii toxin family protein [Planctomycetota bacterium]